MTEMKGNLPCQQTVAKLRGPFQLVCGASQVLRINFNVIQ